MTQLKNTSVFFRRTDLEKIYILIIYCNHYFMFFIQAIQYFYRHLTKIFAVYNTEKV